MTGGYFCRTCKIAFRIGRRPRAAAVAKCGTCGLLTWHAAGAGGVLVGVTAAELEQHRSGNATRRALEAAT